MLPARRQVQPPKRMNSRATAGAANTIPPTEQTANQLLHVVQANNPKRMNGKGKGVPISPPPTEQTANTLLNVTKAQNGWAMSGKGSFGRTNPKRPDRTPASTYVTGKVK